LGVTIAFRLETFFCLVPSAGTTSTRWRRVTIAFRLETFFCRRLGGGRLGAGQVVVGHNCLSARDLLLPPVVASSPAGPSRVTIAFRLETFFCPMTSGDVLEVEHGSQLPFGSRPSSASAGGSVTSTRAIRVTIAFRLETFFCPFRAHVPRGVLRMSQLPFGSRPSSARPAGTSKRAIPSKPGHNCLSARDLLLPPRRNDRFTLAAPVTIAFRLETFFCRDSERAIEAIVRSQLPFGSRPSSAPSIRNTLRSNTSEGQFGWRASYQCFQCARYVRN